MKGVGCERQAFGMGWKRSSGFVWGSAWFRTQNTNTTEMNSGNSNFKREKILCVKNCAIERMIEIEDR